MTEAKVEMEDDPAFEGGGTDGRRERGVVDVVCSLDVSDRGLLSAADVEAVEGADLAGVGEANEEEAGMVCVGWLGEVAALGLGRARPLEDAAVGVGVLVLVAVTAGFRAFPVALRGVTTVPASTASFP